MKSKKEMLDALLAGETLVDEQDGSSCEMDLEHKNGPFVFYKEKFAYGEHLNGAWNAYPCYEIKPRPKKRIMTRWRVMREVSGWQHAGLHRLVRYDKNEWESPSRFPYTEGHIELYEWTETVMETLILRLRTRTGMRT